VIGYEETEVLDVRPAEYYVKVIRREKRACRDCQEQGVETAPVPERIVAKSVLSDQVIIEAVVGKYCASLPLYRQQAMIKRDAGVDIDFRMGREGEGPKQFLGNFNGLLQTDGYKGYNHVGGPKMVHACCLAHARRKYVDAVKVNANDQESARIVALMDELFAVDREAREQNLGHLERNLLRQERAPKLLEQLRAAALSLKKTALPKSAAGQAANYTLSFWSKLTVLLKHPELELSTNLAENSMRPLAIGRKNWLHLGSREAGPKIAAIFSIVESCRRLNIPIRKYLADVLPGLDNRSIQSLAELTPAAYAARLAN
jgi:hypothetical protein